MAVFLFVCLFFFPIKKLYHLFVEKYRRNVEMEQDSKHSNLNVVPLPTM